MRPRVSYRKEVEVEIELADLEAGCRGKHPDLFAAAYAHLAANRMENDIIMFSGTMTAEYEPYDQEIGRGNSFRFVSLEGIRVTVNGSDTDHVPLVAMTGVFEGYCEENAHEIIR